MRQKKKSGVKRVWGKCGVICMLAKVIKGAANKIEISQQNTGTS